MKRRNVESDSKKELKKIKVEPKLEPFEDIELIWSDAELLSQHASISPEVSKAVVSLLEEGNTLPFIARYRRNHIGNMEPDELRNVKDIFEEIICLKAKVKNVAKVISKSGSFSEDVKKSLKSVTTLEELEHVYAPFKPESRKSLAERARLIGLQEPALNILHNYQPENLLRYVDNSQKGLKSIKEIEESIIHIISSTISSDTEVLKFVRDLRSQSKIFIETKKRASSKTSNKDSNDIKNKTKVDESKYELYFNFKTDLKFIKPHQVLAINRGEANKVLTVKVDIPDNISHKFTSFCQKRWFEKEPFYQDRNRILVDSIADSYKRHVQPLIVRQTRSSLKQMAEKASCEQFSKNLKQLFLAAPIKGKSILGIDPGFAMGCKVALISEMGSLLTHNIIYPFKGSQGEFESQNILKDILLNNKCEVIALGNGTACRETEKWLSNLILQGTFKPLKVSYTIVNESGASIYSCSPEAKKEFPKLSPNIISAVSLARRVQEPMAELVKVEPQHLGVGMYQHDLRKKQLNDALKEVVSECVSFVGVDINTASKCLLQSIAGLSDKRAECIIEYRENKGPFKHRKEILKVKGIGDKVFEQCAGFLRIEPINYEQELSFYRNKEATKLDRTIIHPESYELTRNILARLKLKETDIGSASFINEMKKSRSRENELISTFGSNRETVLIILDSLEKSLSYDLRCELNIKPLFREGLTNMQSLQIGSVLSGRVENVTSFGCFVDIGVGKNGLIHVSQFKKFNFEVGTLVEVKVNNLDIDRGRIGLIPIAIVDS